MDIKSIRIISEWMNRYKNTFFDIILVEKLRATQIAINI